MAGALSTKTAVLILKKSGSRFGSGFSIFHKMLNIPRWKFAAVIVIFFLSINLLYTCLYVLAGADQFMGLLAKTKWQVFKEL